MVNALKTKGLFLTISKKADDELYKLSTAYSISKQDIIRQWLYEKLELIPKGEKQIESPRTI